MEPESYSLFEVRALLERYAAMTAAAYGVDQQLSEEATVRQHHAMNRIVEMYVDIDQALERLPPDLYEVIEQCALQNHTTREAGQVLALPTSTVKWRYSRGLNWVLSYVNGGSREAPILRELPWTAWALAEPDPGVTPASMEGKRGRPPSVGADLEADIVELYDHFNFTLRDIAHLLNHKGIPGSDGGKWAPSSIRGVLLRNGVELKGRGRRATRDTMLEPRQPDSREVLTDPSNLD